jgi:magnesium transporter
MPETAGKTSQKAGMPPGSLVFVGERKSERVHIGFIDYGEELLEEKVVDDIAECFPLRDSPTVSWINLDGLHDAALIGRIGEHFGLHQLLVEDVLHTDQRPKVDDYDNCVYIVLKMLRYNREEEELEREQVSLVLGPNWVITFQERTGDVLDSVRQRVRAKSGRIRSRGADYLAYTIVDTIVDNYFAVLEGIGEGLEDLEEDLLSHPSQSTLQRIYEFKRELLMLRKSVWPLREALSSLVREENPLIAAETEVFFRDAYDHVLQVIDAAETFRDIVGGMLDTYISSISNKMNEIMKVLTIIATIFIPLTFIAGVYGMNFEVMPELRWPWGYFGSLGVMAAVAFVMLIYFRRRRWL